MRSNTMQTAKEEVLEILKQVPDNSTLEEIQYHLYVRQKIRRGIKDVEEGRIFTQDEMERRMAKWNVK
jgi:predicted transcriptional regulator